MQVYLLTRQYLSSKLITNNKIHKLIINSLEKKSSRNIWCVDSSSVRLLSDYFQTCYESTLYSQILTKEHPEEAVLLILNFVVFRQGKLLCWLSAYHLLKSRFQILPRKQQVAVRTKPGTAINRWMLAGHSWYSCTRIYSLVWKNSLAIIYDITLMLLNTVVLWNTKTVGEKKTNHVYNQQSSLHYKNKMINARSIHPNTPPCSPRRKQEPTGSETCTGIV